MSSQTTLAASPGTVAAGQPLTLTAGVSPASATGDVTFKDGDTVLGTGTVDNGTATFSVSALTPGATRSPPPTRVTRTSPRAFRPPRPQVNPAATTTGLSLSSATTVVGQPVSLTAKVSPSVKGTVTFKDGDTTLGTAVLNDGTATLSVTNLAAGSHSLTAAYAGDASNAASVSAAATETVVLAQSGVVLTASPSPSTAGSAVTLAATVQPATAQGAVTFKDGDVTLGTGTISGGVATFTTTGLTTGAHALTASYAGDASSAPSTSAAVTEQINPAAASGSQTTLAVTPGAATVGQPVTITANVAAASATGTVTFKDGGTTLGTCPVANGVATLTTGALSPAPTPCWPTTPATPGSPPRLNRRRQAGRQPPHGHILDRLAEPRRGRPTGQGRGLRRPDGDRRGDADRQRQLARDRHAQRGQWHVHDLVAHAGRPLDRGPLRRRRHERGQRLGGADRDRPLGRHHDHTDRVLRGGDGRPGGHVHGDRGPRDVDWRGHVLRR